MTNRKSYVGFPLVPKRRPWMTLNCYRCKLRRNSGLSPFYANYVNSNVFARWRHCRPWYHAHVYSCMKRHFSHATAFYDTARICNRRLSICPSVRPSHGWISQKRLKLGSCMMQLQRLGRQHYFLIKYLLSAC